MRKRRSLRCQHLLLSMLEIVGGAAIATVGLVKLVTALRTWRTAAASRSWRRVEGVITESQVVPYRVRISGEGSGSRIYRPMIRYRYTVDGNEYTSDRIYYGRPLGRPWRGQLDKLVRRYPAGRAASVYVPPGDPELGLLEPGAKVGLYAGAAVFAAMFAVGVSILLGIST
jgi:hypothetical protein